MSGLAPPFSISSAGLPDAFFGEEWVNVSFLPEGGVGRTTGSTLPSMFDLPVTLWGDSVTRMVVRFGSTLPRLDWLWFSGEAGERVPGIEVLLSMPSAALCDVDGELLSSRRLANSGVVPLPELRALGLKRS